MHCSDKDVYAKRTCARTPVDMCARPRTCPRAWCRPVEPARTRSRIVARRTARRALAAPPRRAPPSRAPPATSCGSPLQLTESQFTVFR